MPTITLQDGQVVHISQESYDALKEAVKPKELTYQNVVDKIFTNGYYFLNDRGGIKYMRNSGIITNMFAPDSNNAVSMNQWRQLLALNKLFNVAYYLNEGWTPDWKNGREDKYFMYYDEQNERISTSHSVYVYRVGGVYFKSEVLVQRAIAILGEKSIKECFGIFE